ncbi:hypothetical protein BaRGS_00002443 [Batillaria attramentaria]|uniref:Uncharacterized protein n=1 Tax=Batillaria attramentaria TaxID=370345 RepID=A0ABD0M489_9CAEN
MLKLNADVPSLEFKFLPFSRLFFASEDGPDGQKALAMSRQPATPFKLQPRQGPTDHPNLLTDKQDRGRECSPLRNASLDSEG